MSLKVAVSILLFPMVWRYVRHSCFMWLKPWHPKYFGPERTMYWPPSLVSFFPLSWFLNWDELDCLWSFVKSFGTDILHKIFELPCNVGFHFRIFIFWRLICVTVLGLQCHALALTRFPNPCQTLLIGLQIANQLCQRNFVNILWFFNCGDLGMKSLR